MTNNTLKSLTSRINQEAGLDVFLIDYSKEFNDWPQNEAEYKESYVKAIKNKSLTIPRGGIIFGIYSHEQIYKKFHNHKDYHDWEENNTIFHGIFPAYYVQTTPKTKRVKEKVLWGLLGTKEVTQHYDDVKRSYGVPLRMLSMMAYRECDDIAYFAEMSIKSLHGYGRGQQPRLTLIASQELIKNSVSYLKENPKDYIDFIKGILPVKEFPKVNKGILKQADPNRGLLFIE